MFIRSTEDCLKLQADVDAVVRWCGVNAISMNIGKWHCITFGRGRRLLLYDYSMNGRVSEVRDLLFLMSSLHLVLKLVMYV